MQKNNKKENRKSLGTLREPKFINKERTKILKLNLSATMGVAGAIVFVIIAIITVKIIATTISSNNQKAMAEEETQGYTMVDSTDIDEEGNVIDVQVPVPDGFTASQVLGETTVNGGFVIYEGDVDWSQIEDLDSYAEVEATAEEAVTQTEDASTDNSNSDSSNSENSEDNEEVSIENNNLETTNSEDSNTTNESNIEETEKEQIQDANSEQAELQENVTSEENEISQDQTDVENLQEEMIDTEQTDNIEENTEELEQTNNEIIKEEEAISNEEAGGATMTEEGNEGIATMSEEDADAGIATLAEGETPSTVFELQSNVNQYVWVPVKDASRIYGVDSNGKLWGKLYEYSSSERLALNWDENSTSGEMSISSRTNYREPDVTHYSTNYDVDERLQSYRDGIEQYQMLSQEMEENFYKMIESIKKYGGFYIGRYETGNLNQSEAVVQRMNADIYNATWYEMYELCKNLKGANENVENSMIWGSLWDEILQWLLESEATISTGETIDYTLINNSTNWGNYTNSEFYYISTDGDIKKKGEDYWSKMYPIPTGSTEYTKVNNIYDIAGNVSEWTLETYSTDKRVARGGDYYMPWSVSSYRDYDSGEVEGINYGCRAILYIK